MTLRPREVELTVERDVPPSDDRPGRKIRVTARMGTGDAEALPTPAELKEALEALTSRLDAALDLIDLGVGRPHGVERDLEELVETYRPRQAELVDLLLAEGELSSREANLLRHHLEQTAHTEPTVEARARTPEPERLPPAPRPVAELLRAYQITSLKQAGAVRARRQISFSEYMALKRHFTPADEPAGRSEG